ncbi:MAG: YqhA family protein [Aquificae bacterium]|nr:YqhA family protein [Aquificota bacterium]
MQFRKLVEEVFETFLWYSRLLVIIAVLASLAASLFLFLAGVFEIFYPIYKFVKTGDVLALQKKLLGSVIASLDLFLIATFLIIFSLGLYELFVSKIDPAERDERSSRILIVRNLEDLKTKLGKIIVMVLSVFFFKQSLEFKFSESIDFFYFGLGLISIAVALYLSHKETHETRMQHHHHHHHEHHEHHEDHHRHH